MSHQDAKQIARDVVRDLLRKHPPGLVAMILDQLKIIRRATKDLTIYSEGKQKHETQTDRHP
jgi:hypothetical protein